MSRREVVVQLPLDGRAAGRELVRDLAGPGRGQCRGLLSRSGATPFAADSGPGYKHPPQIGRLGRPGTPTRRGSTQLR